MRITTKGRYAVRAITLLAQMTKGTDTPLSIRKISELEDISPEFLEQIFFKLRKKDIITSVRGPGGGFKLNKEPSEISIAELFDAVEEGLYLTPCIHEADTSCKRSSDCIVEALWNNSYQHFRNYFEMTTLQDVIDGKYQKPLAHA